MPKTFVDKHVSYGSPWSEQHGFPVRTSRNPWNDRSHKIPFVEESENANQTENSEDTNINENEACQHVAALVAALYIVEN
jgi:hypothetical protein